MAKVLEYIFEMEGGGTMTISIPNPPDSVDSTFIKEKAAKIMPVLSSKSGASAISLKKGRIQNVSYEDIV